MFISLAEPTAAVNNLRQVIAVPAGRGTNSSWLVWLLPAVDNLGGVVTHYFCTYTRTRQAGKPSSHQNGSVRTSTTSCNLTNLTSGSVYSANVIACNSAGCSPPATLSVRTSDLGECHFKLQTYVAVCSLLLLRSCTRYCRSHYSNGLQI